MHHMRQPRTSVEELPTEEEVTWVPFVTLGPSNPGSPNPRKEDSPDYGGTEEEEDPAEDEGDEGEEGKKDSSEDAGQGDGGDEGDKDPLEADTVEEYYKKRCFVFVHHFAGESDPLSKAMAAEAERKGIRLKIYSVEKDKGTGNLLEDQPYGLHLRWAMNGNIDAYHAGFPCNTFSVLRFREAPFLPGPIRSKSEPYGLKSNSEREQRACDEGTIMACRAIDIASWVAKSRRASRIPCVATLENPPPSDNRRHLSAWELPEMSKFVTLGMDSSIARFNTCAYEFEIPRGSRHFKPQMFAGTLLGVKELERSCECRAGHEPITGIERSRASATYPGLLCKTYARLAVSQLMLIGKSEFLELKMNRLTEQINPGVTVGERKRERSKSKKRVWKRRKKEHQVTDATGDVPTASGDACKEPAAMDVEKSETEEKGGTKGGTETSAETWIGGEGKHQALKMSGSKTDDPRMHEYLGGLRDPFSVVSQMSNLKSLGIRIRAAWEAYERKNPDVTMVAESYGTEDCEVSEKLVLGWKQILRKQVGAQAPPAVRIKSKWQYTSPMDAEILKAWVKKGNDPESEVPKWVESGAPLGIEESIRTCGIFPPASLAPGESENMVDMEMEDASMQLAKGEIENYTSVKDNMEDARIEIARLESEGYLRVVQKKDVTDMMGHGTISRLGLIVKEKPTGKKRRIIIDMRRSGGNLKMRLPERLVLPRPRDAVHMVRNTFMARHNFQMKDDVAKELVVIDISDAFMSLGLSDKELPHTLTPSIENTNEFYLFPALLFGFKTAPLLWSRTAALVARLLQSLLEGHEGRHAVYLDDSVWVLQGPLKARNSCLALILMTMQALGLKVALKKGERSRQVTWIGVRLTLGDDSMSLAIPEKYTKELVEILKSWEGKGMVSLRELQKTAGKVSWLSGILPRARWVVSTFYAVLHSRRTDVASGSEETRRLNRSDQRDKSHLFPVKQLEQARAWLVAYLTSTLERPVKSFKLDVGKYRKAVIITDASPEGLGGLLLVNNKLIKAFASKVTKEDASLLQFELGSSSSQGIVEALAVLVAIKLWKKELRSCQVQLTIQSDSMVALALTQKLSNSHPSLNFLGSELSIACEDADIESIKASHIPGAANGNADYLSRPSTWSTSTKPADLKDAKMSEVPERGPAYYRLPTPNTASALWQSGQAASNAWDSLK